MISLYGLESVLEKLAAGDRGLVSCNGLTRSAKGLFIASLAKKLQRPIVLLADKAARAEELFDILRFFLPQEEGLLLFPPWEILPYEEMSPHPEVSGARLSTLARLMGNPKGAILVTTVEAMARKTLPPAALKKAVLRIDVKDSMDLELLVAHLSAYGYERSAMVENRGEYSVRGGVVDVFPGHGAYPARLEFFGDEVDSIRNFSVENQRSIKQLESVTLFPFREVFYEGLDKQGLSEVFMARARQWGMSQGRAAAIGEALTQGKFFAGMERLLPLFYPESATVLDYLPENILFALDEPSAIEAHIEAFYTLIEEERAQASARNDIALEPEALFISKDGFHGEITANAALSLGELAMTEEGENAFIVSTRAPERYRGKVEDFIGDLKKMLSEGFSVVISAATTGGVERLARLLKEEDMGASRLDPEGLENLVAHIMEPQRSLFEGNLFITAGVAPEGFIIPSDKWALVTDDEIFGKVIKVKRRSAPARKAFIAGLADIKPGDYVVHKNHGVGRYIGSREEMIADVKDEYMEIEYAENQRLLLPIAGSHLLKKYISGGGEGRPPLDRMGGTTWKKTRAKVKKAMMDMAEKLLKIQAARELSEGFAFSNDNNFHKEFADTFEYEETEDQLSAIADVAEDMEKKKPMDRLVCGDVGYGKTEVAMRAAFKAVYDGRQVAVLAPTTLLTQQHFQTFSERLKSFPVKVEALSRFKSRKEQKEILEKVEAGEVDIVIGTHRILQKDVKFKKLGLVIVDEEQRFGVAHKEKLRSAFSGVDTLTLTATPIPRTLHTAMLGIRDLSVIQTPPADRQSIQTFIVKFSDTVIREAVIREMDRGGQVFFVHNKVKSIHSLEKHLRSIVPEARTAVAHGQMNENELEQVMMGFVAKQFDILLATTIIESGLDIPSANTIIINRADHFGLAQLYQLRGRVGRARHRAFAYFLAPGLAGITDIAKKRLKAIEELSELGSGFKLAARDMEIRGAGNLLGPEQSGNIDAVGFETYCEMLEDAINELKGVVSEERFDVNLNINVAGRVPPEYIPALAHRIEVYNRIHAITSLEQARELAVELADRFGPVPEEVEKLLAVSRIKALCATLKVLKVDLIRDKLYLVFDPSTKLDPVKLATAAYKGGRKFRFTSETSAECVLSGTGWKNRFASIMDFLLFMLESSV
ncbi:MAG: transcription-repair coupling factor [Nitrospinae bacterium]|nr:transcription-repair coupling factor [Nitrospinota bacterium]